MDELRQAVEAKREPIVRLMQDLVALPSYDGDLSRVAPRVEAELRALGFQDIHYAPYGDIVGRLGNGPRVLLYDSHLDTVAPGDPAEWRHGPFSGAIENGRLYGRGSSDEKGSTPGMIYGLALAQERGWLDGWTAYYFGSIEEWCEGLSARVFVESEGLRPDVVVIGEPTDLKVYRGQKGRMELRVTARGRSAHGAMPWLGDNAVYRMAELIQRLPSLDASLPDDPFLGRGSIVGTHIESREASFNAVPDRCSIVLDRRLTAGETPEQALAQVRALLPSDAFEVEILRYDRPSYNGYRREVDQVYPVWLYPESHPVIRAALDASRASGLPAESTGKWNFSTNGAYWAGVAAIPSVGFGPGEEAVVHQVDEYVRVEDLVRAAEWYARFPQRLSNLNLNSLATNAGQAIHP